MRRATRKERVNKLSNASNLCAFIFVEIWHEQYKYQQHASEPHAIWRNYIPFHRNQPLTVWCMRIVFDLQWKICYSSCNYSVDKLNCNAICYIHLFSIWIYPFVIIDYTDKSIVYVASMTVPGIGYTNADANGIEIILLWN